ncbi:MAG TPA: ATP-binding cassette domain-containing protein [Solirubrobacteraceae bacterium]|nr:ATP-binding cassette domain-containing protein [Solirubrobacteraceae bacterium]
MLELREVVKRYEVGGSVIHAVDGVSMVVAEGELVALYGPSGSGKTTLIQLIAGLKEPDSGTILVRGRDVVRMSRRDARDYRLRELGIVMPPSSLQEGARAITTASLKLTCLMGTRAARRQIAPLMVELGLAERMAHRIGQLSMGERQRVSIALALSCQPSLVLADEPTASLDRENTRSVLELLRRLCHERDVALLVVTHDPEVAGYADRVHELRDGRLEELPSATTQLLGVPHTP